MFRKMPASAFSFHQRFQCKRSLHVCRPTFPKLEGDYPIHRLESGCGECDLARTIKRRNAARDWRDRGGCIVHRKINGVFRPDAGKRMLASARKRFSGREIRLLPVDVADGEIGMTAFLDVELQRTVRWKPPGATNILQARGVPVPCEPCADETRLFAADHAISREMDIRQRRWYAVGGENYSFWLR